MAARDAIAHRLDEHRLIETMYRRGCACGDWDSRDTDTFEQHLADVILFYFPVAADHSAERWDEGYIQGVVDLCPPGLERERRLMWTLEHAPRGNPYRVG